MKGSIRATGLFCLAILAAPLTAFAQSYPSKPITVVVPFPAGGPSDVVARIITENMAKTLGQSMVIENVGGAGGTIGSARVALAEPDGYTLLAGSMGSHVAAPVLTPELKYDPAKDFVAVGITAHAPAAIVARKDFPAKDLKEFVEVLKKNPGKYSYATSGVGSINHMLGESFQAYSGTKIVHIPYKGSGPAMQDVMGGQVNILFDQFPSSKGQIDNGKLKAIGAISPQPIPGYPNVMTMEAGGLKGFTDEAWYGLLAPKGTPPDVVAKLTDAMKKALANPDLRAKLEGVGARPVGNTAQEFAAQIRREQESMKKLVKERNIQLSE